MPCCQLWAMWHSGHMSEMPLIEVDERGRASLGKLGATPGRYLGEVQPDGTVILHPATVMTTAQARLLARPDVMHLVDTVADGSAPRVSRGRPRRSVKQ